MNRVQISAEPIPIGERSEIRTEGSQQEETEKESSPEGLDKDNHLWGLYMRAQYSGYKDTEDLSGSEDSLSIGENETLTVDDGTLANTSHSRTARYTEDKDTVIESDGDQGFLTPHLEQTNMAVTDREVRRLAREEARTKGLAQAKEKARLAKERLAKRLSLVQATGSPSETEQLVNQGATPNAMEDHDNDLAQEETDGENEETDGEQKVVLINTGPHRWTPTITTKYMEKFLPLEGKLWIHPRTKRLYEITHVFFYEKEQIAAAYSRVRDGGQHDPTDHFPHRIEGEMGLADLVEDFEKAGGSVGSSRTRWPKSDEDWAVKQEEDHFWGPIIIKMKAERELELAKLSVDQKANWSTEEELEYEEARRETKVYGREKGRVLVYDGVLFVQPLDPKHKQLLYVVPESLKQNICELYHDSKGHPGAERSSDTARQTYWWFGIVNDLEKHVKNCKACARRKARNAVPAVPIQQYDSPSMPWDRVHIDLTGPFTRSARGNTHIVVIKDALTRYVETIPIIQPTAYWVAMAFIVNIIYRHGSVGTLISDNGREFVNKLWRQVTHLLNIKHITTTPYNPRANGLAENHMRSMKDAISIYCDETQTDWDLHLNGITMSYNTTVNSQTGFTPYYMLHGKEARMPSESWLRAFGKIRGALPHVQGLVNSLVRVWERVSEAKPAEVLRMNLSLRPTRHLKYAEYEKGEFVMISIIPKATTLSWIDPKYRKINLKLQPRYAGPYEIIKCVSPVVYVIKVEGTQKVVHSINMKPFQGKKDALTPYAEPGYERLDASLKKLPTPLLISPVPSLNEASRLRFRVKNTSEKKRQSEVRNEESERARREEEAQYHLSLSESQEMWVMADEVGNGDENEDNILDEREDNENEPHLSEFSSDGYESDDDDNEEEEGFDPDGFPYEPYESTQEEATEGSKSSSSSSNPILSSTDAADLSPEESHLADTTPGGDITKGVQMPSVTPTSREQEMISAWEEKIRTLHYLSTRDCKFLFHAARIHPDDLVNDPGRKLRIESWLRKIIPKERTRRSRLSRSRLDKEEDIASMSEIIGWELNRLDENWYPNETFNPTGLQRPPYERRPRNSTSSDGISIEELQGPPAQTMVEESNNAEIVALIPPEPTSDQMPMSAIFLETSDNENSTAIAREGGRQTRTPRSRHQVLIPPIQQELAPGKLLTYVFFWRMSQHAQQLFQLERPPNWDPVGIMRLRTQLDLDDCIPVPIGYRQLYYHLMYDIRRFPYNGLLAPASTNLVPEEERFCNHHPDGITTVCSRVFHHFRGMTHNERREFFHPYKLPPFLTQQRLYRESTASRKVMSEDKLRKHYDRWYWKLLMGCSVEMECEVPQVYVIDMFRHSMMHYERCNVHSLNAHCYWMHDAVNRNTPLTEAPAWVQEPVRRC
jgi:transposase InsO family protein